MMTPLAFREDRTLGAKQERVVRDLTKFFCFYLQATEHPPVTTEDWNKQESRSVEKYRNDPIFYNKVNTLVAHILKIVDL